MFHRKVGRLLPPDSLPPRQFGFRARHSTIDQLQQIAHTISTALEEKKYCSAIFFDVAQAFDLVWHKGFLYKLRRLLPTHIRNSIANYPHDREFFVVYGAASSQFHPIAAGVPQGSVLDPLLYALCTANLPQPADTPVLATFADDTTLLSTASSYADSTTALQAAVDHFSNWATDWQITISSVKSSHVDLTLPPLGYIPIILPWRGSASFFFCKVPGCVFGPAYNL